MDRAKREANWANSTPLSRVRAAPDFVTKSSQEFSSPRRPPRYRPATPDSSAAGFSPNDKQNQHITVSMKTKRFFTSAVVGGAALLAGATFASAAFNNGDLIMSFQATGGTGADQTVAANLGAGYSYRDATGNSLNVINLGSLLSSTYGASWYDRTDLYMTINGLRAAGGSPANGGGPVVNGDARNATYIGTARDNGNAVSYTPYVLTANQVGTAGSSMVTYNTTVSTALASVNQAAIPTSTVNTIVDFTTVNSGGVRLSNFIAFNDSVLAPFSEGTLFSLNGTAYQGAMTLQRMNRYNGTTGALTGNVVVEGIAAGTGSNEGFFAITSSGQVDYIAPIPEPGTWAALAIFAAGAGFAGWRKRRQGVPA
jgi:hypothetical protein